MEEPYLKKQADNIHDCILRNTFRRSGIVTLLDSYEGEEPIQWEWKVNYCTYIVPGFPAIEEKCPYLGERVKIKQKAGDGFYHMMDFYRCDNGFR